MESKTTKELREQANDLLKQAENSARQDRINEQMDDLAFHVAALQRALIQQGFTHGEAYELLRIMIAKEAK